MKSRKVSTLPLYGSERVREWPKDETVVVVAEGEKAADALLEAGFCALGTVTGASGTPDQEALSILEGFEVVLWPDNDDQGRAHMERVAQVLQSVAAGVSVFAWRDAPEKGDAADHPAVINRVPEPVDRLLQDLKEAPIYSSAPRVEVADERTLRFRTAREVAEATPRRVPWKARPWLAEGAITEVDGPIKRAGKTTLVSHMIASILEGDPFMGERTAKDKVVCLTEQSPTSFRKVLERAGLTDREDLLILHWHDTIGVEWADVARTAMDKALEFGAGVLVVDTLAQFAGIRGDSENSAGAAQEAMRPPQEAAAQGLAVLITHHERKGGGEVGESARGSSAFGGAVDVIMSVRRPPRRSTTHRAHHRSPQPLRGDAGQTGR